MPLGLLIAGALFLAFVGSMAAHSRWRRRQEQLLIEGFAQLGRCEGAAPLKPAEPEIVAALSQQLPVGTLTLEGMKSGHRGSESGAGLSARIEASMWLPSTWISSTPDPEQPSRHHAILDPRLGRSSVTSIAPDHIRSLLGSALLEEWRRLVEASWGRVSVEMCRTDIRIHIEGWPSGPGPLMEFRDRLIRFLEELCGSATRALESFKETVSSQVTGSWSSSSCRLEHDRELTLGGRFCGSLQTSFEHDFGIRGSWPVTRTRLYSSSRPFLNLTIHPRSAWDALRRLLQSGHFRTGDREFDDQFTVRCDRREEAVQALDAGFLQSLLKLARTPGRVTVACDEIGITVTKEGWLLEADDFVDFHHTGARLLENMERVTQGLGLEALSRVRAGTLQIEYAGLGTRATFQGPTGWDLCSIMGSSAVFGPSTFEGCIRSILIPDEDRKRLFTPPVKAALMGLLGMGRNHIQIDIDANKASVEVMGVLWLADDVLTLHAHASTLIQALRETRPAPRPPSPTDQLLSSLEQLGEGLSSLGVDEELDDLLAGRPPRPRR